MKKPNTYLCALVTSLVAFACIQSAKADDDCCGDKKYNPDEEECCGGTKVVPKGRCCNGGELEEGFECCNQLSPPLPYNPETTCCTETSLYAKGASIIDIKSKCPDRVQREGYEKTVNGCGTAGWTEITPQSDILLIVSFVDCCNNHDLCYQICNVSRQGCDSAFHACLNLECGNQIPLAWLPIAYPVCIISAAAFASMVWDLAENGYDDAQDKACQCCP